MLRAYRRVFLGAPRADAAGQPALPESAGGFDGGRRWALGLLIAGLLIVGFRPQIMVQLLTPSLSPTLAPTAGASPDGLPPTVQPLPADHANG